MNSRRVKWLTRLGSPLLFLLILTAVVWVRGTWADEYANDPAAPEEGITCQLFQSHDGRKVVRAAVVLNHRPEVVWSRLTAFDRYPIMFPTVKSFRVDAGPPERAVLDVQSFWGVKHLEGRMTRDDHPDRHVLTFEELDGDAQVHLARFTLTPRPGGQSLLVYEVDADVPGYPAAIVRNVFRSRNPAILRTIRDHLDQNPGP